MPTTVLENSFKNRKMRRSARAQGRPRGEAPRFTGGEPARPRRVASEGVPYHMLPPGAPQFRPQLPGGGAYEWEHGATQPPDGRALLPADMMPQRTRGGLPRMAQHASRSDEMYFDEYGEPNPPRYHGREGGYSRQAAWANGAGTGVGGAGSRFDRMYSRRGDGSYEVNAWNRREAAQQAAYAIGQGGADPFRQQKRQRRLTAAQLERQRHVIAQAMQDPVGFHMLGQELLLPIKEIIPYEALGRRTLRTRPLAQGEVFRIPKDVRSTAWVIGQDGQAIEARLYGRYVTPSEFKIGSFPTIDMADVYQVSYDIMEHAQDTARQEVELEEDKRVIALIDRMATTVNDPVILSSLDLGGFEDVRYEVERHRLVVDKYLVNRRQISTVITSIADQLDPVSERELVLAGYLGSLYSAMVMTSAGTGVQEVIPEGVIYAVTAPDYLGELTIRQDLFSEPFNMFNKFSFVKGWAVGELIGMAGPAPRAAAKALVS